MLLVLLPLGAIRARNTKLLNKEGALHRYRQYWPSHVQTRKKPASGFGPINFSYVTLKLSSSFQGWTINYLYQDEEAQNPESAEGVSGTGYLPVNKPCRYGLECSRPNCKFTHGLQFIRHIPTTTGITSKHWVPFEIRLKNKAEGGLACSTADSEEDETSTLVNHFWTISFFNWYRRFSIAVLIGGHCLLDWWFENGCQASR